MDKENIYQEHTTHILFQKSQEGDLLEITCPILEEELDEYREECFNNSPDVEMMTENIFKFIYPNEYKNEFQLHWPDFVLAKLEAIEIPFDIGIEEIINDDEEFNEEVVLAEDFFFICKSMDTNTLEIYFNILCPVFWVAEITKELINYTQNFFEITIGSVHYKNSKNENFFGLEAWQAYKKESLNTYFKN